MKKIAVENKAVFVARFVEKLGKVEEYDHTGDCLDAGRDSREKCVCGHPIRYCYIIKNRITGKQAQVGSECINHFQDYNVELYNSLIATVARLDEEEKKAKELLLDTEISSVQKAYLEKRESVFAWYREKFPGYCPDYNLWYTLHRNGFCSKPSKVYKSKKTLLNWFVKEEKRLMSLVETYHIF